MADKLVPEMLGNPVNRVTFGHRLGGVGGACFGNVTRVFKVANLADSARVALVTAKRRRNENPDEMQRFLEAVLASADRTDVCVIVFPR